MILLSIIITELIFHSTKTELIFHSTKTELIFHSTKKVELLIIQRKKSAVQEKANIYFEGLEKHIMSKKFLVQPSVEDFACIHATEGLEISYADLQKTKQQRRAEEGRISSLRRFIKEAEKKRTEGSSTNPTGQLENAKEALKNAKEIRKNSVQATTVYRLTEQAFGLHKQEFEYSRKNNLLAQMIFGSTVLCTAATLLYEHNNYQMFIPSWLRSFRKTL